MSPAIPRATPLPLRPSFLGRGKEPGLPLTRTFGASRLLAARVSKRCSLPHARSSLTARRTQIDFGTVGQLVDPETGVLRLAYCFVITLCFSRHQYVEFVFNEKIGTWIGCHKKAFVHFGGAVKRLVQDAANEFPIPHYLTCCASADAHRRSVLICRARWLMSLVTSP